MNILIVEDDQMMQLLNANIMEIWGYNYDLAFNGHEAVELVSRSKNKYDVCLMDIEMPEMSGIDATSKIRQFNSDLPIMAYTPDANYKTRCLEIGMDVFVKKPCSPEKLYRIIHELSAKSSTTH